MWNNGKKLKKNTAAVTRLKELTCMSNTSCATRSLTTAPREYLCSRKTVETLGSQPLKPIEGINSIRYRWSLVTLPSGRGLAVRAVFSNTRFFTPPSGRGLVTPVFFFFFFFLSWSLAPDLLSVKTILAGNLGLFSVISPEFS